MGDWLSTLPSRFHCIGTGNNFTNFMLFSRIHPTNHRPLLPYSRELLQKSDFDPSIPTKILIHGFIDNIFISDWMQVCTILLFLRFTIFYFHRKKVIEFRTFSTSNIRRINLVLLVLS